jgi:hypothetical protein
VFIAGLLASAGITILIEALLTGVTDPRDATGHSLSR